MNSYGKKNIKENHFVFMVFVAIVGCVDLTLTGIPVREATVRDGRVALALCYCSTYLVLLVSFISYPRKAIMLIHTSSRQTVVTN